MCRLNFFVFLIYFFCAFNLKASYSQEYIPTVCGDIDCNVTQDVVEKEICSEPRYCFGYRDTLEFIKNISAINKKIGDEKYREFKNAMKNYIDSDKNKSCMKDSTVQYCLFWGLRYDLANYRIDSLRLRYGLESTYGNIPTDSNGVILYDSYSGKNITRKEQEAVCPYIKQHFSDKKIGQDTMSDEEAGVNLSDCKKAYVASMGQYEEHNPDATPYFSLIDYDNDGVDNLIYKMAHRGSGYPFSLQKSYYVYDKETNKSKRISLPDFSPSRIDDSFFFKYNGIYYGVFAAVMERKPRRYGEDFLVDPERLLDPEYWGDDVRPYEVYKISKTGKKDVLCHFTVFP